MADTLVRPRAPSRPGTRAPAAVPLAVAGFLLMLGVAAAAAFAGVTRVVQLPDWWGPWPVRRAGEFNGYVIVELVLLGSLCLLWTWVVQQVSGRTRANGAADSDRADVRPGRRHVWGVGATLATGAAWAAPFLVSGPVGSLDVQSYAAIGRLGALGLDPYRSTVGVLGDRFSAAVDPLWRWTPTPYGPVQVQLLRGVAMLTGGSVGATVVLIRAVAVLAFAAALAVTLRVAAPMDRVPVVVLTALNPVVLLHVVSGAHLDVLIGGLAIVVIALSRREQHATAMAVAVAACAIKLPGSVLMAFVVLDVLRRSPRPQRGSALARTLGAGGAALLAVVLLCPDPFGWVRALSVPGIVHNGIAPSTWAAYLVGALTGHVDGPGLNAAFTVGRTAMGAVGVVAVLALLVRATSGSTRQAYHGVGWALIALAVTGPALYPWYLTWGLFAAALASGARGRMVLVGLSTVTCVAAALGQGWLVFGVWVTVLLIVLGGAGWWAREAFAGRSPGQSARALIRHIRHGELLRDRLTTAHRRFTGRVQEDVT